MSARAEELKKRLEREPGSRLFAQYAEELRRMGETAEAARVCREGLERHPNYPSARITLGRALLDGGDVAAAKEEFERVLDAAPDNILASRYLGECLERGGDVQGAMARYEAMLARAPQDEFVRERVAELRGEGERSVDGVGVGTGGGERAFDDEPVGTEEASPKARSSAEGASDGAGEEEEEEFELPGVDGQRRGRELTFRPLVEEAVPYQAEATATRPMTESELASLRSGGAGGDGSQEEGLVSGTLADLYRRQGAPERALEMYRELLAREPGRAEYVSAIRELEGEVQARREGRGDSGARRVIQRLNMLKDGIRAAAVARLQEVGR